MERKFSVKVVPNAKKNSVETKNNGIKIYVTAKAEDNKANLAVVELLAEHFSVKKRCVRILSGLKSRKKIVEITE
jgi:uncharacterized protein (TIGR00251 family)